MEKNYINLKEQNLTTITPDQNIKDGDTVLSFNISAKQFDPDLGTAVADKITVVNITTLIAEIADLQSKLNDKQTLLTDLQTISVDINPIKPTLVDIIKEEIKP
jgi:hypothetical protein